MYKESQVTVTPLQAIKKPGFKDSHDICVRIDTHFNFQNFQGPFLIFNRKTIKTSLIMLKKQYHYL